MSAEEKLGHGDPEYAEEDRRRIEAFNRGEWVMTGIYAKVDLIVDGTRQKIRTPGLWGIESDSEPSYFKEVAADEYDNLLGILSQLGVKKKQVPPLSSANWRHDV